MKFYALYFLCIAAAISSAKPVANQDLAYGEPATSRPVGKSCMADNVGLERSMLHLFLTARPESRSVGGSWGVHTWRPGLATPD